MKILFLSRWFPFPADNGSKIRIHNILRGLSRHHDVTLLSFYDPKETSLDAAGKYPFCSKVEVIPWKPFDRNSKKSRAGFFSTTPRSLLDTHSPEMEARIRDLLSSQKFDVIIASQLTMASYYPFFGGVPAIFEEIELGLYVDQAFRGGDWISRLRYKLTWFKLNRYFLRLLDSFSACTVVSDEERRIFADSFSAHRHKVEILPNCLNIDEYQETRPVVRQYQLIFSGSFRYRPNYDAIQWFLNSVYPLILKENPNVDLVITGDRADLPVPETGNIILAGYVDDIKSLIASCHVSIAPLWNGGGTRLKILEAMALGTPVVSTSKGAEGLMVQHGEHILIADEPDVFAKHVLELLSNIELHERLSSTARQLVKDHYNWPTILPRFLDLIDKAVVE